MNSKRQQQSVKLFHHIAAHISDEYRQAFYHMPNIGCKTPDLFDTMLDGILETLARIIASGDKMFFHQHVFSTR